MTEGKRDIWDEIDRQSVDGWEMLSKMIAVQALEDYRAASRRLKKNPQSLQARWDLEELTDFFLSDWFETLTDMNGIEFLRRQEDYYGYDR